MKKILLLLAALFLLAGPAAAEEPARDMTLPAGSELSTDFTLRRIPAADDFALGDEPESLLLPAFAETAREKTEPAEAVRVSYLGPRGTYTEEAAQFWFRNGEELVPMETVQAALDAVTAGEADYAVIPQENTLGGAVVGYVDALIGAEDLYVAGEIVLPISQTLMGIPGAELSDIRTVCSHAQGLTQSAAWRAEHLPDAQTMEMSSTAAAAAYAAEQQDLSVAAVAAPGAAALYGLEVLAENVQISDANRTRFYVLSRTPQTGEGLTHAVLIASCEGKRIAEIVSAVRDAGLEIVCLHDRPEGSRLGVYHYVMEVKNDSGIDEACMAELSGMEGVRFAGAFRSVEKEVREPQEAPDEEDEYEDAA